MGRVQTRGLAPSRPLSPSRLPLRANFHRKRDVWVRGRFCDESNWEAEGQNQKLSNRILFKPHKIRMCFILWLVLLRMEILQFFFLLFCHAEDLLSKGEKFFQTVSSLMCCLICGSVWYAKSSQTSIFLHFRETLTPWLEIHLLSISPVSGFSAQWKCVKTGYYSFLFFSGKTEFFCDAFPCQVRWVSGNVPWRWRWRRKFCKVRHEKYTGGSLQDGCSWKNGEEHWRLFASVFFVFSNVLFVNSLSLERTVGHVRSQYHVFPARDP